jgi:hypothetical protein
MADHRIECRRSQPVDDARIAGVVHEAGAGVDGDADPVLGSILLNHFGSNFLIKPNLIKLKLVISTLCGFKVT